MIKTSSYPKYVLSTILKSIVLFILYGNMNIHADNSNNPMEEPKTFLIKLKKNPTVKDGKISYLGGIVTKKGDKLKLPGLSVDQEVRVVLISDNPNKKAAMELRKFYWAAPNRKGITSSEGYYMERFRTEGDVYIKVYAFEDNVPVHLFVWVSDPKLPPMKPVLVPKSSFNSKTQKEEGKK